MKYIKESFLCKPLARPWKPYRTTVNNGYVIETQDDNLIEQLIFNEHDRNGEAIDWFLFEVGKTILIDNAGNKFGCVQKHFNYRITLDRIL